MRKYLFDDEYQHEQIYHQQECSWKRMLTSTVYTSFRQYIGERLLTISRKVRRLINNEEIF